MVDNEMFATLNQDLVIKGKFYDKENLPSQISNINRRYNIDTSKKTTNKIYFQAIFSDIL